MQPLTRPKNGLPFASALRDGAAVTTGWSYLAPLEKFSPATGMDVGAIDAACDQIAALNRQLRRDIEASLRAKRFHKFADGLHHAYANDEQLFNAYFANKAYSFAVPSAPPDRLDGCRMAIVFHMSETPQATLLGHLRGVPTAEVANAKTSTNPEAFRTTYRYTNLRATVSAIKSVQLDVENFAFGAMELLTGTDGTQRFFRAGSWPFDADILDEQVLLGFMRTGSPSLLNSDYLSSAIVAAGLVRSHLESVLFRNDFQSVLAGHATVTADKWDAALKQHRNAAHVSASLSQWISELYGLLSLALHEGKALSRGEVWAFRRVVNLLREALNPSSAGLPGAPT